MIIYERFYKLSQITNIKSFIILFFASKDLTLSLTYAAFYNMWNLKVSWEFIFLCWCSLRKKDWACLICLSFHPVESDKLFFAPLVFSLTLDCHF